MSYPTIESATDTKNDKMNSACCGGACCGRGAGAAAGGPGRANDSINKI